MIRQGDEDRAWLTGRFTYCFSLEVSVSFLGDDLVEGWRRFLTSFAERGPVVVVIEDLHWASDELVGFLGGFAERAGGLPVLLITTARQELGPAPRLVLARRWSTCRSGRSTTRRGSASPRNSRVREAGPRGGDRDRNARRREPAVHRAARRMVRQRPDLRSSSLAQALPDNVRP